MSLSGNARTVVGWWRRPYGLEWRWGLAVAACATLLPIGCIMGLHYIAPWWVTGLVLSAYVGVSLGLGWKALEPLADAIGRAFDGQRPDKLPVTAEMLCTMTGPVLLGGVVVAAVAMGFVGVCMAALVLLYYVAVVALVLLGLAVALVLGFWWLFAIIALIWFIARG